MNKRDTQLGWEVYQRGDTETAAELKAEGRFFDVPVEMVGVWDTVKATNDADYHDAKLASNVTAGYHAMAIDERRKSFSVLKWNKNSRISQVWFAGAHSDVGGGCADCGLADVALEWMIYRSMHHDLEFDADLFEANVNPNPKGMVHDSYDGIWKLLGKKKRRVPDNGLVHPSLKKRGVAYRREKLPAEPKYWQRA